MVVPLTICPAGIIPKGSDVCLTWRPFQPRLVTDYACRKIVLHSGKYESVHEYLQESEQKRGISKSPYRRSGEIAGNKSLHMLMPYASMVDGNLELDEDPFVNKTIITPDMSLVNNSSTNRGGDDPDMALALETLLMASRCSN
ncbi:hypothetical protein NC653_032060 [Populus alba x Populus x berolinensis]|uniref:Uncharacterized protein n=1 Tax=Populus alba x Populus x berolinensis TaxID=444605 RepID=A0AAD6LQN2_9ROSI|nr:hypothetical protein NC653_032060 [Populus alba x Populus x berolinensis]